MDFIAVIVCNQLGTGQVKYINKEFENSKGYYPENNKEDIAELIKELEGDDDIELYGLEIIDVCEIIDSDGNPLWNEI